ncbi:hypothetical protein GQ42DRAFT_65543 [Ramicandelaber brevisporus]|nr:hypothetical protein GQ42DRAFT_65543 [Ramicandelaber brevisporus]
MKSSFGALLLALALSTPALASLCQDGRWVDVRCNGNSAWHTCLDYCRQANTDGCHVRDTGCPVKATCEIPEDEHWRHPDNPWYWACCECGCRQGNGSCEHS